MILVMAAHEIHEKKIFLEDHTGIIIMIVSPADFSDLSGNKQLGGFFVFLCCCDEPLTLATSLIENSHL